MTNSKPSLHTVLSPRLLELYELKGTVVVIIDVLRATSTIATALSNGAASVVPVDDVRKCVELGNSLCGITAGERDGKIADGLQYGNSPFEYPRTFVAGKTLVLTTTNGTRLLHMALNRGADHIITGSFANLSAVCRYITEKKQPVVLACSAWKDRINIEDTLFAGAVIQRVKAHFSGSCDANGIAETLYQAAQPDLFEFLKRCNATHYQRLTGFGLERDLRYCLTADTAEVVPFYENPHLVVRHA